MVQKGRQMWLRYALTTSSAFLDLRGMQNVNSVSIQAAVNAYLFPLLDAE